MIPHIDDNPSEACPQCSDTGEGWTQPTGTAAGIRPTTHHEDALREARIERLERQWLVAHTPAERSEAWDPLQAEIRARCPRQVAKMERERGLR